MTPASSPVSSHWYRPCSANSRARRRGDLVAGRGFLREGYAADLLLVDDTPFTVRREDVLSKCGWSPFEGRTFHSRIASTWVNGVLAWDGSRVVGAPQGQRLEFAR